MYYPRRWPIHFLFTLVMLALLSACGTTPKPGDRGAAASIHKPAPATVKDAAKLTPPPANSGRGGYYQDDGPAENPPENLQAIPDAEPKIEPYSRPAARPYVVFGKTYTPITDNKPFKQRGLGTWYGKKFHKQKTSSGELYDMFKMTAAHPTLPIPSYARVTNLANGAQVIVRINDRGPFHSTRIIDLSYTAALKLGYVGAGSATQEVERLLPEDIAALSKNPPAQPVRTLITPPPMQTALAPLTVAPAPIPAALPPLSAPERTIEADIIASVIENAEVTREKISGGAIWLQFGAFSQSANAEALRSQLAPTWAQGKPQLEIVEYGATFRLYSGPFMTREDALAAAALAVQAGVVRPVVVVR